MVCNQCQELLSDYIDGSLELGEQVTVEHHLADCEPCRAVRDDLLQIVHFSRQLPEHSPSGSLWARIESDIASQAPPSFGARASAWLAGVRNRHFNLSIPQMVAGAAALVIIISISIILLRRDGPVQNNTLTAKSEQLAIAAQPLSNPEVLQIEAKIDSLNQSVEQRKASWPPELRNAFDRNMAYVQTTIMQCRHQLEHNPGDDVSQELMMNAYLEKLRVLEGFDKF